MWPFRRKSVAERLASKALDGHSVDPEASGIDAFILRRAQGIVDNTVDEKQGLLDIRGAHLVRKYFVFDRLGMRLSFQLHVADEEVEVHLAPFREEMALLEEPDFPERQSYPIAHGVSQQILTTVRVLGGMGEGIFQPFLREDGEPAGRDAWYVFGVVLEEMPVRVRIGPLPPPLNELLQEEIQAELEAETDQD